MNVGNEKSYYNKLCYLATNVKFGSLNEEAPSSFWWLLFEVSFPKIEIKNRPILQVSSSNTKFYFQR